MPASSLGREVVQRFTWQTTTRPNLQAGVEPCGVAKALLRVRDLDAAAAWLASFEECCGRREGFPSERTAADDGPAEWGDGLVWAELHRSDPWRTGWD